MTIVQLEYLVAVANYESFSVASEHCFVTQPSLSTQIKNLETELNVVLINRNVKGFELTEAGRLVVGRAKEVIAQFNGIKESVNQLKNTYSGKLRLAVIPTIAPYLVHKFAPLFLDKYKDIDLEIKEMYTVDMIVALEHDAIDIAVLAGGFTPEGSIKERDLYRDKFYLYCSERNPLFKEQQVEVAKLDLSKLLLLSDGHCLRTQILNFCGAKTPQKSNIRFESGSLETLMRIVEMTDGVTIIPEMALDTIPESKKRHIRPFVSTEAYRNISLAVSKNFVKYKIYEALQETLLRLNKIEILEKEMLIK